MTKIIVIPAGNKPEGAKFVRCGVGRSANGIKPKIAAPPIMINAITATTFILANQNSASAKPFVVKAFKTNKRTINTAHHIQIGTLGNQCCIKIPAAVNSTPAVAADPTKYIQPNEKPAEGLMKRVAYVWKEPVTGM